MEENQTEIVEQVEQQPEVQEPDAKAIQRELDETKATLQRKSIEFDFYRKANEKGIANIDKVMPFLDFSKISTEEGVDTIGEIIGILSEMAPQQKKSLAKPLGEPTNGAARPDKSSEAMLREAGEKAKRTGKIEDVAAFSTLKQRLFGGK